tara:strand:- start:290 stop:547 length:258 start_codon:yes stop_codon:yes gene_type:complete
MRTANKTKTRSNEMKTIMKKGDFEQHLFKLNNNETLGYRKHNEHNYEDGTNTIIHLYYNDNGHIGTWQKGGHYHVFEERLPKEVA